MLMIPARLVRSESFWAIVKVRSPHTDPEPGYPRMCACSCAGGGRGHAGLDQRLSLSCSESTDLAAVLGFNFTEVLRLGTSSRLAPGQIVAFLCTVFGFCYLFVWGYIADLSMVPRLSATRARAPCVQSP